MLSAGSLTLAFVTFKVFIPDDATVVDHLLSPLNSCGSGEPKPSSLKVRIFHAAKLDVKCLNRFRRHVLGENADTITLNRFSSREASTTRRSQPVMATFGVPAAPPKCLGQGKSNRAAGVPL